MLEDAFYDWMNMSESEAVVRIYEVTSNFGQLQHVSKQMSKWEDSPEFVPKSSSFQSATDENIRQSLEKQCSVCLEFLIEKPTDERQFGILQNCQHCFCYGCIWSWKLSLSKEGKNLTCPVCSLSNSIQASVFWIDDKKDKEKIFLNCR